jgi:hypothetical protein
LIIAILTRVRWNLGIVFICISFMAKGVEHFFMYSLVSCIFLRTIQFICTFITWIVYSFNV